MPIIQVPMEVSEATYAGLLVGVYERTGGVVRNHGKIIEHLKDTRISEQDYKSGGLSIAKAFKKHKYIVIGLGVVTVGGIMFYAIKTSKNKKNTKPKMPKCVVDFNNSLFTYLEAVRNGNLDMDNITGLISDLDEIKKSHDSGKINIDFSIEQLNTLINLIFDYTRKLAEANSVELNELEEPVFVSADNTISNLHCYLEVQKQIFENVA